MDLLGEALIEPKFARIQLGGLTSVMTDKEAELVTITYDSMPDGVPVPLNCGAGSKKKTFDFSKKSGSDVNSGSSVNKKTSNSTILEHIRRKKTRQCREPKSGSAKSNKKKLKLAKKTAAAANGI